MINLDSLQQDPDFLALPESERTAKLAKAQAINATLQESRPGVIARAGRAIIEGAQDVPISLAEDVGLGEGPSLPRRIVHGVMHPVESAGTLAQMAPAAAAAFGGFALGGPGGAALATAIEYPIERWVRGQPRDWEAQLRAATGAGVGARTGEVIPGVISRGTSRFIKEFPGAEVEQHAIAYPKLQAEIQKYAPPKGAAEQAYTEVQAEAARQAQTYRWTGPGSNGPPPLTTKIPATKVLAEVDSQLAQLAQEEKLGFKNQGLREGLETLKGTIESGYGLSFSEMKNLEENLMSNQMSHNVTMASGPSEVIRKGARREQARVGKLIGAVFDDVDAIGNLGSKWAEARDLYRRERAVHGLARLVDNAQLTSGQGAWLSMGGLNRVINVLRESQSLASLGDSTARLFVKSFNPGELNEIISTFRGIRKGLPAIRAGKGVPTGSSMVNPALAAGAAIGGEAGEFLGEGKWGQRGRVIGAAMTRPLIAKVAEAMTTDGGRKVVRFAVHMDPSGGAIFRNLLSGYLSTQAARREMPQSTPAPPAQPQPLPTPAHLSPPKPPSHTNDPAFKAVTH